MASDFVVDIRLTLFAVRYALSLFWLIFISVLPVCAQEEPITLQLKWRNQFQFAGYYAAVEKGYYREVGLNVTLREAQPGEEPMREVVEGRAEFGVGTTDLLLYRSEGKPVVLLASIFQHSALALLTLKQSGIENLHDLADRTMMIEPHSAELFGFFHWEGIDIQRLQVKSHSFNVQDLINGRVQAMSVYDTDEPFLLKEQGIEFIAFRPISSGIDFYGDNLFTTDEQIRRYPKRVQAFVEASLRGWNYAMEHPEEIVDSILTRFGSTKSREHLLFEAAQMKRLILPHIVDAGYTNTNRWEQIVETYKRLEMLPDDFSLNGFFYSDYQKPPYFIFYRIAITFLIATLCSLILAACFYVLYKRMRQSELRYRLLADNAQDVIWTMDIQGRFMYISPSVEKLRGYTGEEARRQTLDEALTPESVRAVRETIEDFQHTGQLVQTHWLLTHYCKDGSTVLTETTLAPLREAGGQTLGLVGIARDVTEKQRAAETLAIRYIAMESASDGIVITDSEGHIEYVNPAFTEMTGYSREESLGRTLQFLDSGEQETYFYETLWETIQSGQTWRGELINKRKDGVFYHEEQTVAPVCDDKDDIIKFVAIKRDISSQKQYERQLTQKAYYDYLTQLPNRALLYDRLNQAILLAQRKKSRFALLYLDLDGFKAINDRFGHKNGDFVLQEAANRLREHLRKSDTVARFGGDEFVILLMDVENRDDVQKLVEKIMHSISHPIQCENQACRVSASVGVSIYPLDGEVSEVLLRNADEMMYKAKNSGKHRVCFYEGSPSNSIV